MLVIQIGKMTEKDRALGKLVLYETQSSMTEVFHAYDESLPSLIHETSK